MYMKQVRYMLPAMAWIALITVLSLISAKRLELNSLNEISGIDLLAHLILYGILSVLLLWGISKANFTIQHKVRKVIILSILLGILMECLQYLIGNGRNFDFFDIIANIVGTYLGSKFYLLRVN